MSFINVAYKNVFVIIIIIEIIHIQATCTWYNRGPLRGVGGGGRCIYP